MVTKESISLYLFLILWTTCAPGYGRRRGSTESERARPAHCAPNRKPKRTFFSRSQPYQNTDTLQSCISGVRIHGTHSIVGHTPSASPFFLLLRSFLSPSRRFCALRPAPPTRRTAVVLSEWREALSRSRGEDWGAQWKQCSGGRIKETCFSYTLNLNSFQLSSIDARIQGGRRVRALS